MKEAVNHRLEHVMTVLIIVALSSLQSVPRRSYSSGIYIISLRNDSFDTICVTWKVLAVKGL